MKVTKATTTAVLAAACAALCGAGSAYATGTGISGKKLLLKRSASGKEQMVLLSKDPLVVPGANGGTGDPRCAPDAGGWGGAVVLDDGTNKAMLGMPCGPFPNPPLNVEWTTNGAGTLYKYKDAKRMLLGPKVGQIKAGLLKVVSPTLGSFPVRFPVPNGPATINVTVRIGLDKYCMAFNGTGDGKKFLAKNASSVPCPGVTPGCAGESVGGTCWYIGEPLVSCEDTCGALVPPQTYDSATDTFAGNAGTNAGCTSLALSYALGFTGTFGTGWQAQDSAAGGYIPPSEGVGCLVSLDRLGQHTSRVIDAPTTASAVLTTPPWTPTSYRLCACHP